MNSVTRSTGESATASLTAVWPSPSPPLEKHVIKMNAGVAMATPPIEIEAKLSDDVPVAALSLSLAVAVAIIVGLLTVILSRIDAASPAKAALRGGTAFGSTLLIGIAVIALFF
ncbi:hypothetical protein [Nocardia brasiliensis]